ncbi:MAG: DUF1573 domain-containing protein [Saprospiraceae bacterium]
MRRLLLLAISSVLIFSSCLSDKQDGLSTTEKSVTEVLDVAKNNPIKKGRDKIAEVKSPPSDTVNVAQATFTEEAYNFGTIDEGEKVKHNFKFKNTGKVPLVITNARGSCGCTVPVWPKEPIAVGETGEIEVAFNSKGKKGKQKKSITLTANTWPTSTVVYIEGDVTPDPNKPVAQRPTAKTKPAVNAAKIQPRTAEKNK